ncbi:MAG TPA: ABC transporter permease [Acidimicrobiia bacterium]
MIAFKEMARAKVRFGLLIGAIALLVFLILFQQALRDGLITSFVGAIERQTAPVLVYSTDGRRNLQSSSITPALEAQVRAVDGVARAGKIGQSTFSVRAGASITGAAVIGYEHRELGAPQQLVAGRYPRAEGEGVANETDAGKGFGLGDVVRVEPRGYAIRIVGQSRDTNLQAIPTVFTRYGTWEQAVRAANPDARTPLPNAMGLAPAAGVSAHQLVTRVDAVSNDLEALTRRDAARKAPGVAQVSRSFLVIFLLYGLVVPLVIGLFFLIVTLQKARTLTLLRAIGARSKTLVWALLQQVLVVVGLGVAIGTLLYLPLSFQRVGSIPLHFDVTAVVGWGLGILVLGVASSWFSARRVLRIDPMEALSGGGLGS